MIVTGGNEPDEGNEPGLPVSSGGPGLSRC